MSWNALDWATESDIRSPTTKFVLHLLANKAQDTTKGGAERSVPLAQFAVDALHRRKGEAPRPNTAGVIFPSSAGTLRDPDNFGKQWRQVRESLGLPDVSSHSFRKTVAKLIDDSGLSARIGADQFGHARPSMTQDVYMSRGQVHAEVADVLDLAAGITDE
jgi:integrase